MTFWISQGKVATADRWGGNLYCNQIFSEFQIRKNIKIG